MAVTPNSFVGVQAPKSNTVNVATANSTYTTSPTNTALLVTAGSNGARLQRVTAIPCETISTASQIQLFRSMDAGVTKYFFDSALMQTYTMAQNTKAPPTDFGYSNDNALILQPNERIYVATGQAKSINVTAEWGDY